MGDGILVAHNASFDIKFVNYEQKQLGKTQFTWDRVVDTLEIAKTLFPGARVNLDALCKRYNVDNTDRTLHGALLDAQLLAQVYLELLGGREPSLLLDKNKNAQVSLASPTDSDKRQLSEKKFREPRVFALSEEDEAKHREFLEKKIKNPIWLAEVAETEKQ